MATTITDYMDSEPTAASRCGACCKVVRKVLSFLLSHIGLLSLVVGYVIMGAFIFEELEKENELMVKRNMTSNRHFVTEQLWDITRSMEVLSQDNWTSEVTNELRKFEKSLIIALKEKGWDGNESEETVTWTFAGGLFYSITVITTIGYGHIAPKTPIAKIVTIFYAILGIPLTVLCWSNIGDAMANAFRFCYWRIFCYICTKKDKSRRKKRALSRQRGLSVRYSSSGRGRSVRRSQRPSQRSADTISDSINSYSFTDPDRFYEEDQWENSKQGLNRNRPSKRSLPRSANQALMNAGEGMDGMKSNNGEPSSSATTPPTTTPTSTSAAFTVTTTTLAVPQSQGQQATTLTNSQGVSSTKDSGVISNNNLLSPDKDKKTSAASRMVRGLGLKRGEHGSSQKSQRSNGSGGSTEKTSGTATTTTPATPPTTLGPFPTNTTATSNSVPSSPTTNLPIGVPPVTAISSSKGGTPPILVPNRGSRPPSLMSPTTPTTVTAPSTHSYRLDRVPEDEWIEDYYEDYVSEDDMEDYSTKPVPIWLSVCLVIAYIIGGAFIFQDWEGWSLLDSSYFCFITLTTIGFGDLVPDQKNTDGELRIALCSLYLLFGIAMICMSFNLVQEEVINSVKGIGKQLGILKDDDEDEDY